MTEKKINIEFFKTSSGREPVKEWLDELNADDFDEVQNAILKVEYSYPGPPNYCKKLLNDLWECRVKLAGKREVRIIFCVIGNRMIALDSFFKKKWKTEIETAMKRKKSIRL
jgi:hypothetical protein